MQLLSKYLAHHRERASAAIDDAGQRGRRTVIVDGDDQATFARANAALADRHTPALVWSQRRIPCGCLPKPLQSLTGHDALKRAVVGPHVLSANRIFDAEIERVHS